MYNPPQNLAIDEAMIGYRGFKSSVQKSFMPCKPTRAGFKVYALATPIGYMLIFFLHEASSKMLHMSMRAAEPVLGLHQHIFTDKAYTSIA